MNMGYYAVKVIIFNRLFDITLDSWQFSRQPFLGKCDRDWGRESSKKGMQYNLKDILHFFFFFFAMERDISFNKYLSKARTLINNDPLVPLPCPLKLLVL